MKSKDIFSGPYPLDEQRRMAEAAGFMIVPAPDAPATGESVALPDGSRQCGMHLFTRDPNLPIYPESRPDADCPTDPVEAAIARDEVQSVSLAVHAIEPLTGLDLEVSTLKSADGRVLPVPTVRVLEPAYIQHPEEDRKRRLVVLTHMRLNPNAPVDVPRGTNRQFWVDLTVPGDAEPGLYRGLIHVRAAGRPSLSRELRVRVRPYRLEQLSDFFFGTFMSLRFMSPDREALADFKARGIEAMLFFYSPSVWSIYRSGEGLMQWFYPLIRLLDDAAAVGMRGPIVIGLGDDNSSFYEQRLCELFNRPLAVAKEVDGKTARLAAIDDEVINRLYIEGLREVLELAQSRRWPEIVLLPYDEPTERLMPEATHRYRQIKESFPGTRVYGVTMNTMEWARQVETCSDILVCNGSYSEIRELAHSKGKAAWGYNAQPAVLGAGGARFNMGFRLWRHRMGSHWFWSYNWYSGNPWDEFQGNSAGNVVVYPGRSVGAHVPTLAWEGTRMAHYDVRHCATLESLLKSTSGVVRDRIAAAYEAFLDSTPEGRDRTAFRRGQDEFYATLPSYRELTRRRNQLADWIEELHVEGDYG